jgi:hypothetical protein
MSGLSRNTMKITLKEERLLRRALDRATTDNEAESAAKAFIDSLRKREVSSYEIVPP